MATKKQQSASRRNAKHSTGPKTPAGKAASSMNALKHGLRAQKIVMLPGESEDDFADLCARLHEQYQPQTPAEQDLVEQAAVSQWKLARAETLENDCYQTTADPIARTVILNRMSQIQSRFERSYFKAYKELERIKDARPVPAEPPAESPRTEPPAEPAKPQPPATGLSVEGKSREYYRRRFPNLKVRWYVPESGIDEIWLDNTEPKDEPKKEEAK
jgi:hypothetical protein